MILEEALIERKPREIAGSTSSSRFDFQKDYSICKLLDTHLKQGDYLFLFDFQEDLVIIDSEVSPLKISFYQIKGKKSGNWSLNKLLKRNKSKDGNELLSILGKLYECKMKFDSTDSLNFVSNQRIKIKLKDNTDGITKDCICLVELSDDDINKIKDQLKIEHSLTTEAVFEKLTYFRLTDLSLDDSETHALGKLTNFLVQLFPNASIQAPAIYRNLFGEVKRRSDYQKECKSFSELAEKKGISKNKLDTWIRLLKLDKDFKLIWDDINNDFIQEGIDALKRRKLKNAWTDLEIKLKDPNDDMFHKILEDVKNEFETLKKSQFNGLAKTSEILESIFNIIKPKYSTKHFSNDSLLKAIILLNIYE